MNTIQELIEKLAQERSDNRLNVFEIEPPALQGDQLTLSGRVLDADDFAALTENITRQFPGLHVDASKVRVLRQPHNPQLTVGVNLTSLHKSTSFISEMTSQLVFGEEVEVLEELERWVYIRQPDGYLGWTFKPYLAEKVSPAPTHIVLTPAHELRAAANASAPILSRIFCGTRVRVSAVQDGWAQVQSHVSGWLPLSELRDLSALPQSAEACREQIVRDAQRLIGVPYLWGGVTGNGIDCSGFARLLYRLCGLDLPRDADLQSTAARRVEAPLEPGDLFFFGEGEGRHISHVGVSMGGWKVMHSSRSRNGIYLDDLQENTLLRSIFLHGGTFLGK